MCRRLLSPNAVAFYSMVCYALYVPGQLIKDGIAHMLHRVWDVRAQLLDVGGARGGVSQWWNPAHYKPE